MAGSPRVSHGYWSKPDGVGGNEVILCYYERNFGVQKHLRPIHHHDNNRRDSKCEHVKGAMEGEKLMLMFAAKAMQAQRKRLRGVLA